MSKVVALTGTSGAMGGEVLLSLLQSDNNLQVRCVFFDEEKRLPAFVKKTLKKYGDRVYAFKGDISRYDDCVHLIDGADYVINCASLIPPKSDHDPVGTYKSNFVGTKNLVDAIIASGRNNEISYVHVATVAMYGHRAYPHLWIRVGDPMISSDYDVYSLHKLKAEKYVLESGLKRFVSLRQTAVLHKYMFKNNLKDGLMFHTTWNCALEWVTDVDSGILVKKIIEKDTVGELDGFWNRIYNIGGGEDCRVTGFESLDDGFKLMGKGVKKFFKPNWNSARNFHGGWFYDSDELENYLNFRTETNDAFWKRMGKQNKYIKLGAIVPSSVISKLAIKRLFKNSNSPAYWLKHGKEGRIRAFFGGREKYESIPSKWEDYPLLCEGKLEDGSEIDYKALKKKENAKLLDHGYDDKKPVSKWTLEDLQAAAAFRGGKCLSTEYDGNPYDKVLWECRDGHKFAMNPYTVLKGGYWCHCCEPKPWRYGAIADIPFYGQVYFDSHEESETDNSYPLTDHEEDFIKK
jgi:nucleoside-diphosphate-sugar epimerase